MPVPRVADHVGRDGKDVDEVVYGLDVAAEPALADEVHEDVRALTNVALGLSPPSRAFYNKVLGGLVQVEHDDAPPADDGPVPYAPLRVSVDGLEKQDSPGRSKRRP